MTGYGKGVSQRENLTLTVELKAVNNRFLEINARLPKYFLAGEEIVRKEIGAVIKRGTVDFFYDLKDSGGSKTLVADYELAKLYCDVAKELSLRFGVLNELTTTDLMRIPDMITVANDFPSEVLGELLKEATSKAVSELEVMRVKEGESIKRDFKELIASVESYLCKVVSRAPSVVEEYREKLQKRISEYLGEVEIDAARLVNEVAFFADKADINEEIKRLRSHIAQFKETLESERETGRKLDFLAQEMNREVNTMGSKSNDIEITNCVVAMKNELEKIKEQIRNVE